MKRIFILCLVQILISSCTSEKRDSARVQADQSKINFDSQLDYAKKDFKDMKVAAQVDGEKLSWEQLRGSDPALKELNERLNEQALAFSYAWAQHLQTEEEEKKSTLNFFGPPVQKELEDVLGKQNVSMSEGIEVSYKEATDYDKLAEFANKTLQWSDFFKANINHSKTYEKLFSQQMRRLNGMAIRRYILKASKKEKLGMEEYIQKNILNSEGEAGEEEIRAFAKEKGISESDLDEQMIKRLGAIVNQNSRDQKMEAYVAKNLQQDPILIGFPAPELKIQAGNLGDSVPQWGDKKNPNLMFIGHWSCEDCPETLQSFLQSKEKWKDEVHGSFVYSFPESDRLSRMGAEAGFCVESLSSDSFWSFLASMADQGGEVDENKINSAVKATSVDFDKFRACFLKRQFQQKVDTHLAYAKKMGITSAPLMVFQGQVLPTPTDMRLLTDRLKNLTQSGGAEGEKKGFFSRIKAFFGLS